MRQYAHTATIALAARSPGNARLVMTAVLRRPRGQTDQARAAEFVPILSSPDGLVTLVLRTCGSHVPHTSLSCAPARNGPWNHEVVSETAHIPCVLMTVPFPQVPWWRQESAQVD